MREKGRRCSSPKKLAQGAWKYDSSFGAMGCYKKVVFLARKFPTYLRLNCQVRFKRAEAQLNKKDKKRNEIK
jgi:hypothetical protein